MKPIRHLKTLIGVNYPTQTGRHLMVEGSGQQRLRVALCGDSTIDNGYWVQKGRAYKDKTSTVTYQAAAALAGSESDTSFELGTFAVDGATTTDLPQQCDLDKVLPVDEDHWNKSVHQFDAIKDWKPDVVVMSVGGNNYREALQGTLQNNVSTGKLLFRQTPEQAKAKLKKEFKKVKDSLLEEYKANIEQLLTDNPELKRLVIMSQYLPSLTQFTGYFIYTGFSHIARAEGGNKNAFEAMEDTMNELYRELLQELAEHVTTQNKEVVFVDVTSSMNPLGNNHTMQIEPNKRGAKKMGRLIAAAVEYEYPQNLENDPVIARLRMSANERDIQTEEMRLEDMKNFEVKKISQFIAENRYRHVGLFFSPSSGLLDRYENAYHIIMGKDFDSEYKGLIAFGLLDVSIVTVMATYLWRTVALDQNMNMAVRLGAAALAAPILIAKAIVGISLLLALSLPILGYHFIAKCFDKKDDKSFEKLIRLDSLTPDADDSDDDIDDRSIGLES